MRFNYQVKQKDLRIDLTPLIDVVFFLIIFFLVTSSFVQFKSVRVNLPQATSAEQLLNHKHLAVEIDEKGKYFLEEKQVAFDKLQQQLSESPKEIQLTISADKRVAFEAVMKVWDLAREQGIKEVVVLTT